MPTVRPSIRTKKSLQWPSLSRDVNGIDATDYHDLTHAEEPRLSPADDRVAFVRREPDDEKSSTATVHTVPVGGDEPTQFTVSEGVDSQPRWRPDGEYLAFASTRGESDRQQLWVVPTDGGEARRLTGVVGGVGDLEWSPDGSKLLFTQQVSAPDREHDRDYVVDPDYEPEKPDPRVVDRMVYRAATEYFDGRRSHVYVVDVETALEADESTLFGDDEDELEPDSHPITRLTSGDIDYVGPTWGDAETIYYGAKVADEDEHPDDSLTYELYEHDLAADDSDAPADEETRERDHVTAFTETTGWVAALEATADGLVAFTYTPEEKASMRQTEIRVHDRTDGTEVTPTETLDRTVGYGSGFQFDPAGESLYFATPDEGSNVLWSVPADASDEPTKVHGDGATVEAFSVGEDSLAFAQSEWDHPGDIFVSTRGGNEVHRLTRVNADLLADRPVRQPEEIWFENDGTEIQGWVLTPPEFDADATDEAYPLVVEIHGGPHSQWTTAGTMWHEFQTLAAEGYVVFWCNPRGSTGYGEEHAMAIERDWGDVTLSDVLAGVEDVCERDYVDEDEQYVTGGSFGGFMTAWTVANTDRFEAAVSQRGVYDLTSFYGSTDAFKLVEGDFDTTPWEEPEFLWEQSPVAHVDAVDTPTLVLHSDRDYRTPANTAELFYLGLQKHGVDTRLVRYPREGHELSRSGEPGHVVDRIERIVRWFDGYSDYTEAPPALERDRNEGLSAGSEDSDEE
ncbi:dipeptidyl aminopeptidase/acylaminoacyl peptidase [Natronobacterium gregoryi SP2]|uniref:Dipeptidyl aminopeptidase/acylaminoacyl peptidase n=1 Tax=Natronobacterium gregoryi (strain ATCC 43098 / DSM 3393 / CCM 3738 / CIP 104747 / IAM 13177 / JCM 8860 / NBRC 102187 / NCIMB 2189 / SP2) TaxID=797304 RepID=L0AHL4_NATGS|nr:dipeptidyl aminopeptidase/acylaminoacyl peptidase [Natronobacterium gregoryi SP2]